MMHLVTILILALAGQAFDINHDACTNYLVTRGASADGSNIITYAADSHVLYGALYHYPAADHAPGEMRKIIDWDSGEYIGQIPEVAHTYNVIGNQNEWAPSQPGAIVDYGSLIYIALQRSKTAREAIKVMTDLVAQYGYASEGESFSIGDPNELWVMEMIGKGAGEKGAVWVARRIPDGMICAHANQARITTFPLNDPDNCYYSADVVDFAKRKGLYPASAPADQFSFSDAYNPITFDGARFCDVRVWSFFRKFVNGMDAYLEYAKGYNLTTRMPLWVRPVAKIMVFDVMNAMRDHLEGTWFDFRGDAGAEAFGLPYRWRPLTWDLDGKTYFNERTVATQQTGWSFVSQMRSWLPAPLAGLFWFGVDDTAGTVYAPFYGSATRVPWNYDTRNGDMMTFSFDSAFWVFNLVTNFAYQRYSIIQPEIAMKIQDYEMRYLNETVNVDVQAMKLYQSSPASAVEYLTAYSEKTGSALVQDWLTFFKYLFVKYMDGNVKVADPKHPNPQAGAKYRYPTK
ncbi:putative peptidase C69 [Paratrimastix pyriformis]|uniref:Peptidase C69 n=1 Tax=Paratrimastix pyriformis TaxID=342808 RepID=A0ABQ8UVJ8_9EUKA|nr:putative peptidase C69 [Paratrimastix pyriformis]